MYFTGQLGGLNIESDIFKELCTGGSRTENC